MNLFHDIFIKEINVFSREFHDIFHDQHIFTTNSVIGKFHDIFTDFSRAFHDIFSRPIFAMSYEKVVKMI